MANNPNQITGSLSIRVDGRKLPIEGNATVKNLLAFERTPVVSNGEVLGYTEKALVPSAEATVVKLSGMSLTDFKEIKDASVQVETDTGDTYILSPAWVKGGSEFGEGKLKLVFEGKKINEILGS